MTFLLCIIDGGIHVWKIECYKYFYWQINQELQEVILSFYFFVHWLEKLL
jgi:hypothetical protein